MEKDEKLFCGFFPSNSDIPIWSYIFLEGRGEGEWGLPDIKTLHKIIKIIETKRDGEITKMEYLPNRLDHILNQKELSEKMRK